MLRRLTVALVLFAWVLGLTPHAREFTAARQEATSIASAAARPPNWVQPSSSSRDLVRPPARNLFEAMLLPPARSVARALAAPDLGAGRGDPDPYRALTAPARRILHHSHDSSADDASPA